MGRVSAKRRQLLVQRSGELLGGGNCGETKAFRVLLCSERGKFLYGSGAVADA